MVSAAMTIYIFMCGSTKKPLRQNLGQCSVNDSRKYINIDLISGFDYHCSSNIYKKNVPSNPEQLAPYRWNPGHDYRISLGNIHITGANGNEIVRVQL